MASEPTQLSHYRLLEKIGVGGFGEVYRAEDVRLGRRVAVKLLPQGLLPDPKARRRFLAEARAVAALEHPNVCLLYEYEDKDERPFLVMQLIEGRTLKNALSQGPLAEERAAEIAAAIGDALVAAHARGILHRDVKSENILLGQDGAIKLADFGLALLLGGSGASSSSYHVGTPPYMAPEIVEGNPATEATDQYSLGVVAYEAVTGTLPFAETQLGALLYSIVHLEAEAPTRKRPGLSPRWDAVLDKALAKDPAQRYRTMRDFVAALREIGAAEAWGRRPSPEEIQELIHQGQALYARYTHADNLRALECLERATAADPDCALAWAGIADCCGQMHDKGWDVDRVWLERGLNAAQRAIQLDPGVPQPYKALALVQLHSGDEASARASLRRAIEVDPRFLPGHVNLAAVLRAAGDFAGAERSLRRARALNTGEPFVPWALAHLLLFTRRYRESLELTAEFLAAGTSPYFQLRGLVWRACNHIYLGDYAEAERAIRDGQATTLARFGIGASEALLAAHAGKTQRALQLVEEHEVEVAHHLPLSWLLAEAAAWAGEERAAVRILRVGDRNTVMELALVRVLPGVGRLASRRAFREWIGERGRSLVWPSEAPPLSAIEREQFADYSEASGLPESGT